MLPWMCMQNSFKMSKQRRIEAFFTPSAGKRPLHEDTNSASKIQKTENCSSEGNETKQESAPDDTSSEWLSPKQKLQIESKKLQAKLKLLSKQTNGVVLNFGSTWLTVLEQEFSKPYFVKLSEFLQKERQSQVIYPSTEDVFSFTTMCEFKQVKVVILGQDPYHGPDQAHGLCFSVRKGVAVPPSLQNMYKELATDITGFLIPKHGYLEGWAKQGVVLLNAVLTVRANNANSHKEKGWETFSDAVVTQINDRLSGVVFLLWGKDAQKKGSQINKSKHHILTTVHPSPLSAHRGFIGCQHFSKCNQLLISSGKEPINWCNLP